ncbi:MAG: hypothetical protein AMXMBFR83_16700 [Phycisphaerae bacterium]|jgi:uncharacterized protein YkwD
MKHEGRQKRVAGKMNLRRRIVGMAAMALGLAAWGCGGAPELLPAVEDADLTTVVDASADLAGASSSNAPAGADCIALGNPESTTHQALVDALNQYRIENGLKPLIYSKRLEAAADGQVRDLWQRGYFSHINPEGQNPGDRAIAAGFCHKYVGENLAAGQRSVSAVMTAWQNSPGHNANMLEPEYRYVGVSFSVDQNGRMYWAQEFAYELP